MKKKKFNKKLSLNKKTISKLDASKIKGGYHTAGPDDPCHTDNFPTSTTPNETKIAYCRTEYPFCR